jgi:hypothetical protein
MRIEKIGNKKSFSIIYQIIDTDKFNYTDTEKHKWLYGHLCFYAQNVKIGVYKEWTSLVVVSNYLKDFLANYIFRFVEEDLYNQPNEIIFNVLYEQFYTDIDVQNNHLYVNKYNINSFAKIRNNFHLDDVGEDSFRDKFGVILINSAKQEKQKLIWKNFKLNKLFCVQYDNYQIDKTLKLFYDNLINYTFTDRKT